MYTRHMKTVLCVVAFAAAIFGAGNTHAEHGQQIQLTLWSATPHVHLEMTNSTGGVDTLGNRVLARHSNTQYSYAARRTFTSSSRLHWITAYDTQDNPQARLWCTVAVNGQIVSRQGSTGAGASVACASWGNTLQ